MKHQEINTFWKIFVSKILKKKKQKKQDQPTIQKNNNKRYVILTPVN